MLLTEIASVFNIVEKPVRSRGQEGPRRNSYCHSGSAWKNILIFLLSASLYYTFNYCFIFWQENSLVIFAPVLLWFFSGIKRRLTTEMLEVLVAEVLYQDKTLIFMMNKYWCTTWLTYRLNLAELSSLWITLSEISAQISLLENVSVSSAETEGTDIYENHKSWEL